MIYNRANLVYSDISFEKHITNIIANTADIESIRMVIIVSILFSICRKN